MSNRTTFLIALSVISLAAPAAAQGTGVFINGRAMAAAELTELKRIHNVPPQVPIPAGRYWYDKIAGLWGMEGGPTQGQILPGMNIGVMRANVSGGGTGVFINGREIHPLEVAYLQRIFGYVVPGRYWLSPQGIGGVEGGPAAFNLFAAAQQAGGSGGYTRRTLFGSIGGDGNGCSYYMSPDGGSSVMTGNC